MIALGVYLLMVAAVTMIYLGPPDPLDDGWIERSVKLPVCFLACALVGLSLFAALCIVMRPR